MSDFIDIIESGPKIDPLHKYTRHSTLEVTNDGLRVLGNLPHGYIFKPTSPDYRDALVEYLTKIQY